MTAQPTRTERAIEMAAIGALKRKANELRASADKVDVQRALNKHRLAAELDDCASSLVGIAEAVLGAIEKMESAGSSPT